MPLRGLNDEHGFTLIELLVTMFVLLVGMGGAIALIDGAAARTGSNKQRAEATALARELLESARAVPYARLTQGGAVTALQGRPGLADEDAAGGWQIKRRGSTYTITLTTCSVDDPRDGTANSSDGYCSTTAASTPPDRNSDDYKRVTVELDWKARGIARSVRQAAVISNESTTTGPRITSMSRSPNDDTITSKTVQAINFAVSTDRPAAAVKYAVDGTVTATDAPTGAGTSSTFSWRIDGGGLPHVPDGTYLITATAYDAEGHPGTGRSLTVRLNRDSPAAVQPVRGGWNATREITEIEWSLNNESDIQGYRTYVSVGGGARTLVPECSVEATVTRCAHLDPPKTGSLVYYVVAVDADALTNLPREGDLSAPLPVTQTTNRPNQPGAFSASTSGGDVNLTWTLPAASSPSYTGDAIAFFRIYRDGEAYVDRHDYTGSGTDTTLTDRNAAGGGHTYWITAVDENFSESLPLGPVSVP